MRPIGIERDDLDRLYVQEKQTMDAIAASYSCSQATVRNYMLKYDIPIRSKSAAQRLRNKEPEKRNQGSPGESNPNYRHGAYIQERIYREMIDVSSCAECGSRDGLVVHHKNGDHYDNHPENLQVLCRSCHQSHHKQEWWDKQHAV